MSSTARMPEGVVLQAQAEAVLQLRMASRRGASS